MTPRPIVGEIYDRGGYELTVMDVCESHVLYRCPDCIPHENPLETAPDCGHVLTLEQFFASFQGFGPFTQ